ncbi:MAG: XRE family transcriptional regulator, partial [Alphaproteobacteria bacterium]|nr:XRE family transcriptional regulator [Alphaproteobacteria bacterium]
MAQQTRNHNKCKGAASDVSRRIGANMRFFRRRAAIPQKEVAKLLGVSYQQLQKYETGVNRISAEYIYGAMQLNAYPQDVVFNVSAGTGPICKACSISR